MKQFNFEITDSADITAALQEVFNYTVVHPYKSILFHLYSIRFDADQIKQVQDSILEIFADAKIGGTSSNGDICDGHLAEYGMVIAVSAFETTEARTLLLSCEKGKERELGIKIRKIIDATDNIKAAELFITLKSINSKKILEEVEMCDPKVQIFGGGSAGVNISDTETKVISEREISGEGVMLITYAGNDLNIDIHHAIGWKPLGKDLIVTKIEGKRLYELDGIPASHIYSKYLDIQADETFFNNVLEFPLMTWQHGQSVLRLPFECHSDGSIDLAAELDKGAQVNLSYGDPEVIRSDVEVLTGIVREFAPEAIFLYSCGVRRLYWKYLLNKETGPFYKIAPVCGYYSSGEIMRVGNIILEHHVTLIAISMREGEKPLLTQLSEDAGSKAVAPVHKIHSQISMVRRLANFINVTAAELRAANDELQEMADTDALTGLNNRRVIDKLVRTALLHSAAFSISLVLGIIDIDDFKDVNDTYGHSVGDKVLVTISGILKKEIGRVKSSMIGRWGGEEFLFIFPNTSMDEAVKRLEDIRVLIEKTEFEEIGTKTISIGMTAFCADDTGDEVFQRADEALYEAKGTGKNKICVREKEI